MYRPAPGGAFEGLRVIDLAQVRSGPTCVKQFADFGADVIRIEPPPGAGRADLMTGPRDGADMQNLHRNKRLLTLDLKAPQGREVLHRLVRSADVLVENYRPDVKERLGLDYETLAAINPRIILASISGFGQDGPYALRPGVDQIVQGMGGLMTLTGTAATGPLRAGLAVSDLSTGLFAAIGVLVALREREVSGRGQWVQASLLHSMIAMMDFQVARYVNDGAVPQPAGNDHPTSAPMGLFDASDGRFNIGATGEATWRRLCETIGRPDWVGRPEWASEPLRVRHRASLTEALQAVFAGGTVDRWVRALNDAGVPAGPLYTVPELVEDPQVRHLGVVAHTTTSDGAPVRVISQPVKLSRTPAHVARGAPDWGEQTDEILGELGYSAEEIADLRAARAV